MIRYVIFDVMGVVFTVGDDVEGLLIPYIHSIKPDINPKDIKDIYLNASLGKISSHELWEQLGFASVDIPDIERNYLENAFTLDVDFLPCVNILKPCYHIALLSNDISEWSRFLREYHGIEPLIDAAFISGDLGYRKPDPEIYRIALDRLDAKPNECIFIDDYPSRVDTASELGIISILFDREGHDYSGLRIKSFKQLEQLLQ
ncbi:MAG: HAD-IA family hydrolase [Oscillospiraceae bacterium]|nr:HAD-IA family hydrolase [Oscillospiraceae bacterium]